jgi:carbamoylphosphate synthase large subunit
MSMGRAGRVLLSEAASLTAREHVTALGAAGVRVEAMSSDPLALCRWSRWVRRLHSCPPAGVDPVGYLDAVGAVLARGGFDALLPTHEQAWLFAVARDRLPSGAPVALAPAECFARVQSKIAFAQLLDEIGAPQPRWWLVEADTDLDPVPYPYFLKTGFGTAGQGVRAVRTEQDRRRWFAKLRADGQALMAQEAVSGQYGQVQALFDRGRLVAAHTSVQTGTGVGGSAAARLSVDHPRARHWAAVVGEALRWRGGLTMDYFHTRGEPVFIECNPRTVEPGNAVASGVNLPLLSLALAAGWSLPDMVVTGRPGVRTHGTLALLLGTADRARSRRAVLHMLVSAGRGNGVFAGSAEVLTPLLHDPPSLVPLVTTAASLLAQPAAASRIAGRTVAAYSVTEQAISRLGDPEPA